MGVPNRQIGGASNIENQLLWDILNDLDKLAKVVSTNTGGGGGDSYTFSDGLTNNAGNVGLGGIIGSGVNIEIDGGLANSFDLYIGNNSTSASEIILNLNEANLTHAVLGAYIRFKITDTQCLLTTTHPNFAGLEYSTDFSSNYTDRSLIDLGFANATYAAIPSDKSLKNNVLPITSALSIINRLNPVTFEYKNNPFNGFSNNYAGFIAQEVDTILPDMVDQNNKGLLQLKREHLVPYLVKAIQELSLEISELKKKI